MAKFHNVQYGQLEIIGDGEIGRNRYPDLPASVSRSHIRIEECPDGVYVKDLGSSNGSYLVAQEAKPGVRVPRLPEGRGVRVSQGQVLRLGGAAPNAVAQWRVIEDRSSLAGLAKRHAAPVYRNIARESSFDFGVSTARSVHWARFLTGGSVYSLLKSGGGEKGVSLGPMVLRLLVHMSDVRLVGKNAGYCCAREIAQELCYSSVGICHSRISQLNGKFGVGWGMTDKIIETKHQAGRTLYRLATPHIQLEVLNA